jgi:excisionase family DNA binding protein
MPNLSTDGPILLTTREAAQRLRCSSKTLLRQVAAGQVRYVLTGTGMRRPRRMFTPADLDDFVAARTRKNVEPWQSTKGRGRRFGGTSSKFEVVHFANRQGRPTGKPPKP